MSTESHEQEFNITTTETPASLPARTSALSAVADYSDRKLCLFHYNAAKETMDFLEHDIRDYSDGGEEAEPISTREAKHIVAKIDKITAGLALVRALALEAADITARGLPAPLPEGLPDDHPALVAARQAAKTKAEPR